VVLTTESHHHRVPGRTDVGGFLNVALVTAGTTEFGARTADVGLVLSSCGEASAADTAGATSRAVVRAATVAGIKKR
jgi:hypothetical protein